MALYWVLRKVLSLQRERHQYHDATFREIIIGTFSFLTYSLKFLKQPIAGPWVCNGLIPRLSKLDRGGACMT